MNYTLHQLKIFKTISECKSITKAAELLHLTQPAVSIQLKKLQDQFEIPLTERIGRKIFLTDFGNEIAAVSERILKESEELKNTVSQFKGILTGKLKFSIVSTGKYVLPYFLHPFIEQFPSMDISIDVSNKSNVLRGLVENTNDFYLVSVLPDDVTINAIELMPNNLYLFGSPLNGEMLDLTNLSNTTFLFREEGSATRMAMEGYLKKNNITGYKSMELVSNEAVKQAVCAGMGYSIMPLIGSKNEISNKSMHIIDMDNLPITTSWFLIYHKDKALTPAAKRFIQFLNENKQTIVSNQFNPEMQ
ncbi:MAG: LysR family transcriptional regulator [Lishizhenia sp.]